MLRLDSVAISPKSAWQNAKSSANKITPLITLDTHIAAGEVLTLMGPSGCGKSTLLHFITGFLPDYFVAEGHIWLHQQNITSLPAHQRGIGILYQESLLFEHLTVAENIAFAWALPTSQVNKREAIITQLAQVGLADFADRYPATLSGGQKMRVALLRTLAAQPKALLLDEPFSKLDLALRDTLREWLFQMISDYELPTLMVTHDKADAEAAGGLCIELM